MTDSEFTALRDEVQALRREVDALRKAPAAYQTARRETYSETMERIERELEPWNRRNRRRDRKLIIIAVVVSLPLLAAVGTFGWILGSAIGNWADYGVFEYRKHAAR